MNIKEKVEHLDKLGLTVAEIATKINRSIPTVYKILGQLQLEKGVVRSPGRPLSSSKVTVSFRLPPDIVEWLDSLDGDRTDNLIRILQFYKEKD